MAKKIDVVPVDKKVIKISLEDNFKFMAFFGEANSQ